jgi:hypothetical protein
MAAASRGIAFSPADRACIYLLMQAAIANGWRNDIARECKGYAEAVRLYAPVSRSPAFLVARIDAATVELTDSRNSGGTRQDAAALYPSVTEAFVAASRVLAG